jgi:hypothetical protein
MAIIDAIEDARADHERATGRAATKLKVGKKQMRAFEDWAKQFTFGRDPQVAKGAGSVYDGMPIEATDNEDLLEFE